MWLLEEALVAETVILCVSDLSREITRTIYPWTEISTQNKKLYLYIICIKTSFLNSFLDKRDPHEQDSIIFCILSGDLAVTVGSVQLNINL